MHLLESSISSAFYLVIDVSSALIIVGYCAAALVTAIRSGLPAEAHGIVARGAILGMSVKLVGACLKTLQLQTWNQIGMFAAIFALRFVLKKVFLLEKKFAAREGANG